MERRSAVRKAAERRSGHGHVEAVWRGDLPYVALAKAVLTLAAEDALHPGELGVRARSWLQKIAEGEAGWWDNIPGFDGIKFARRTLRITQITHPHPASLRHPPLIQPVQPVVQCLLFAS